jgi:hypothetical protein
LGDVPVNRRMLHFPRHRPKTGPEGQVVSPPS